MTLTTFPPSSTPAIQSKDGSLYTSTPESALLNVSRLVARLELNLLSSTADLDILRRDPFRRGRVSTNIEYARKNLQSLEKTLPQIKPVDRRHEILNEVGRLRTVLKSLGSVIEEVASSDAFEDEDEGDDTSEDLLATPEDDSDELEGNTAAATATATETPTTTEREIDTKQPAPSIPPPPPSTTTAAPEPTSILRNRHNISQPPTATTTSTTFSPTPQTKSKSQTPSALESKEQTLSTHQSEQETLTTSLLDLATQLKTSSQNFQTQLEGEKSILSRAVDGLDKTSSNMDAAERRMGMLRRMTEGKGWWGRMMLYAWIFAGWVLAILIVFVGPKIRF